MKKIKATESQALSSIKQYADISKDFFLQRNNVGAWRDKHGNYIKYGLGEGSSDLIGSRQLLITQDMVGKKIAQYCALEVKKEGWVYSDTPHEKRQKDYIDKINKLGGYARFVTCIDDIKKA